VSKVKRLLISNIKGVRRIEIIDPSDVVVLSGKNGQGKSTVLDSIRFAVGGKSTIDDKPLRNGEELGQIVLETEELIISRMFDADGTKLKVKGKEGGNFIQRDLDKMFNALCVDPLEFTRLSDREQVKIVRLFFPGPKLDAIDVIESKLKEMEVDRTLRGRERDNNKCEEPESETPKPVPTSEIVAQIEVMQDNARLITSADTRLLQARNSHQLAIQERDRMTQEIETFKLKLSDHNATVQSLGTQANEADMKHKELLKLPTDTSDLTEQLKDIEFNNEKHNEWAMEHARFLKYQELENSYQEMSTDISQVREDRDALVSDASKELPVPGLRIEDGKVWFNQTPFSQLSSGERLTMSTKIAISADPKLKVLLVKNGESLDPENFELLKTLASDSGFQLWVEQVQVDEDSLELVDGRVEGAPIVEKEMTAEA